MLTLPSDQIKPRYCVIINQFDAPTSWLIAAVNRVEGDLVHATYLSTKTNSVECCGHRDFVTPVSDFGIEVGIIEIREGKVWYTIRESGDSVATYEDGSVRSWQEDIWGMLDIRDEALAALGLTSEGQG